MDFFVVRFFKIVLNKLLIALFKVKYKRGKKNIKIIVK
jgi:hypothetical protein